jgi:hypothetical protein
VRLLMWQAIYATVKSALVDVASDIRQTLPLNTSPALVAVSYRHSSSPVFSWILTPCKRVVENNDDVMT